MPNATSQSIKDEVIRLHILGHTNKQIAQNAGTSTGNVSNIINEFKNHIDEGDYQNTKVLANLCKINDIKPSDVLDGIATNRLLKNNDLGRNGFEKHVQAYSKLPDTIESSELVNYSLRLYEIDSRTDTNIEDIPKYYESLLDKSQKLESKIESQQKQSQELTLQTSKELKKRDITLERLEQFDSDKKFLLKLGLDVDDSEKYAKMINCAKFSGYNIEEIQEHMIKEKSLDKRMLEKQRIIDVQTTQIKDNEDAQRSQKENIKSLQKKLDQYKKEYQEEKGAIDSLKKLKTKGITTGDIKRWEHTIRNCSKSVAEFDDSIKTLDDVVSITNNSRAKINDLKTNIAKKKGQNDALDEEILEKESKLEKLDEQISNTIKIQFEKITKNTAHTISKVRSLLDFHDVEIKSKRTKYLDVFNDDLKNIVHDIQNALRELTLIANVDGKFSFCEPLYILTTEGKGEKNKVYLCMISLLTGLELWLKNSNSSYPLQSHTRHLKNVFEESLSKHTIAS